MSMERNVTKRTLLTCEHWDISVLTLRSSVSKYQIFVTKFTEFVGLEGAVGSGKDGSTGRLRGDRTGGQRRETEHREKSTTHGSILL